MKHFLLRFFENVFLMPEGPCVPIQKDMTDHYRRTLPGCVLDGIYVACDYDDLRDRIIAWKYAHEQSRTKSFARPLREALDSYREAIGLHILVSVPTTMGSWLRRGYSPSDLLARSLASHDTPYLRCIRKIRKTKRQATLDRADRLMNVKNAFAVKKGLEAKLRGQTIVIIDDLITTGATANEIAIILRRA